MGCVLASEMTSSSLLVSLTIPLLATYDYDRDVQVLNVVMGCNDNLLADEHKICTAASCTTNCIAPAIKVVLENLGISHGSMTTIHNGKHLAVDLSREGIVAHSPRCSCAVCKQ